MLVRQAGQPVRTSGAGVGHGRGRRADRHQLRPAVSLQGPLAGAGGQAASTAADDDWNQHRSDVANLTRYVESRWKRDLTWQVIDLRAATVDDLLQSPVLYLCGSDSPLPDDAAEAQGAGPEAPRLPRPRRVPLCRGLLRRRGVRRGFRELMEQVFPEPEYRLQLLAPEHPIWHAEEKVDPEQLRPLLGHRVRLPHERGLLPRPIRRSEPRPSLSCLWELSRAGRGEKYQPPRCRPRSTPACRSGINVLAYATNRELKYQGRDSSARRGRTAAGDQVERGRLYVAKLRHPGGCNAAPRALVNLLEAAGQRTEDPRRHASERAVDITDDALFDYHLVFMHGRNAFRLTDAERKQLKTYLERGGMLFADSICASQAFTESFRREMAAIFPDQPLEPIPADDPLLTHGLRRLRPVDRHAPRSRSTRGATGPLKAAAPQGAARAGRHQARRPLGRGLLAATT